MSTLTALKPLKSLGEKIRILPSPDVPPIDTPTHSDTASVKVLVKARQIVARGWIQGAAQNDRGTKFCAQQAINEATHELRYAEKFGYRCQSMMMRTISVETGTSWGTIPNWNDAPGRTQQQVLTMFDKTIETARKVGA